MLATVTGAVIASFFGVYGTLIGTAVISVASTVGAAFYQATLQSGKDQLIETRDAVASRARAYRVSYHSSVSGARHGEPGHTTVVGYWRPDDDSDTDIAGGLAAREDAAAEDEATAADGHRAAPPDGDTVAEQSGHPVAAGETAAEDAAGDTAAEDTAHPLGAGETGGPPTRTNVSGSAVGDGEADTVAGGDHPVVGRPVRDLLDRIGWKRVAAVAAVVFVVAVGVVTAIELLAGKPLNALVSGRHSSGTSVSNLFGGQPATGPSLPQPSHSSRPGSTAPASPSAQPTQPSPSPKVPARAPAPSPSPKAPSTIPGNGAPPSASIPPADPPTRGAVPTSPNGQRGTSAWGSAGP